MAIALGVVVLFLMLDRILFGALMPWGWLSTRVPRRDLVPAGVVADELTLQDSRAGDDVVIGASRIGLGFHPERLPEADTAGHRFSIFAHPGMLAIEMRSVVSAVVRRSPRLVVLGLSELDSNGYMRLQPCVAGSLSSALFDILSIGPARFLFEHRQSLLRLGLASVANVYQFRRVIRSAGLDRSTHFDLAKRLPNPSSLGAVAAFRRSMIRGPFFALPGREYRDILARLRKRFPGRMPVKERPYFHLVRSVTKGDHAVLQQGLLSASVEDLVAAGIPVVIVELPIYPLSVRLYDPEIRVEFHRWVDEMRELYGVRFVPLEQQPDYEDPDFVDMTHLNRRGAAKLTRVIVDAVR